MVGGQLSRLRLIQTNTVVSPVLSGGRHSQRAATESIAAQRDAHTAYWPRWHSARPRLSAQNPVPAKKPIAVPAQTCGWQKQTRKGR